MILQVIKRQCQARRSGLGQINRPVSQYSPRTLGKTINGHLQLTATTKSVEKAGLNMIITPNQIVRDKTNQAERSGMNDLFEQFDGNRIKSPRKAMKSGTCFGSTPYRSRRAP